MAYTMTAKDPATIVVLLFLILEVAALVGLFYVFRYTIAQRSGLNDPEKLRRIWRRSSEIRYQPVFKAMLFAVLMGYGTPSALSEFALNLVGIVLPEKTFKFMIFALGFISIVVSGGVTPIIYRASGGTKVLLSVAALFGFTCLLTWLTMYEVVPLIAARHHESTRFIWAIVFLSPLVFFVLQLPFVLMGMRYNIPDTAHRIYSPTLVPDWVRLNRAILVASGPIVVALIIESLTRSYIGVEHYLAKAATLLSSQLVVFVCGIASIISVNRALLAEDFRWQWRAFLTPAIPVSIYVLVILIGGLITGSFTLPVTGLGMVVQRTCRAGASGTLGAYLYLYKAEQYALTQMDEVVSDGGEELFGSDLSGDEGANEFEP